MFTHSCAAMPAAAIVFFISFTSYPATTCVCSSRESYYHPSSPCCAELPSGEWGLVLTMCIFHIHIIIYTMWVNELMNIEIDTPHTDLEKIVFQTLRWLKNFSEDYFAKLTFSRSWINFNTPTHSAAVSDWQQYDLKTLDCHFKL